ncbi:S28 family serine protease [Rhizohabitans arisaemae]|uniref:S28 family serine protease n=1 Tax=Rhizohabitans arisaemae TaxID=2720610 RepID=UPI0024B0F448|nr:S28 family serine protease [Rhizohabitans arisaemae]
MPTWKTRILPVLLVPALAGTIGLTATPAQAGDIADELAVIPGLTVVSETQPSPGFRLFFLEYRQPADHRRPSQGTFGQRLQLLHRSADAPMVLHTTGYNMPTYAFRSEPTRLVDGNQISVEHRFFLPSRPDPADWRKLDIWQAASDHHRIVRALKPLYPAKWISTGASKGGMASVYHRRFYPGDVDGTVAYVAPNDVIDREDHAYDRFFAQVGTDPACRAALNDLQREALLRREELVRRSEAAAAEQGLTFTEVFGTADKAFEMTVLDTAWAFWQYSTQTDCASVPATTATTDEIYAFIDRITGFSFYSDQGITPYAPYFYQAATQLGAPGLKFRHLRGLLRYPGLYQANSSLPPALRRGHDPRPMIDVDHWVRTRSGQMLFVNGANDPWSAEPFHPSRRDSFTFTAPGSNHGASIARLTAADQASATTALRRWAQTGPALDARAPSFIPELDRRDPRDERRPL